MLLATGGAAGSDSLHIDELRFEPRAQAHACYLGFIDLYRAEYLKPVTGEASARCVRLTYLRDFSVAELDEATREVFGERHGAALAQRYRGLLADIGRVYRPVSSGDRYTYCVVAGEEGVLLRDDRPMLRLRSTDFATRFLQIWVAGEDAAALPRWAFDQC